MLSWKNIFKSWVGVPVLILVAFTAVLLLPGYKSWQIKRAYDKAEEPYYTDTYGGATPEETYDLFIDALKSADVELASKYFVIEKQDSWLKTLQEYEKEGIIISFVEELENTKKTWKKSEKSTETQVSYVYMNNIKEDKVVQFEGQDVIIPVGNYQNGTIFIKYPSGAWKIELL